MGKEVKYPLGVKIWPSKPLSELDIRVSAGEPRVSQQVVIQGDLKKPKF